MYYDRLTDIGIKLRKRSGNEKCKCPKCSDARKNKHDLPLSVNITTGQFKCHNCGWCGNVRNPDKKRENKEYSRPPSEILKSAQLQEKAIAWFASRGISISTLSAFSIFTQEEWMPQTQKKENCVCFPYMRNGSVVNMKYRDGRKNFKMFKDAELILYNLQSIGDRKKAILVEGEIDCLSIYEVGFGHDPIPNPETGEVVNSESEYAVLSVPNGASKGNAHLEYLENCFEFLVDLEEIIIATDDDEAGKSLKDELIRRIGIERCKTISYPSIQVIPVINGKRKCKDANEVLMYLGSEALKGMILNADFIPVEGIYFVEDLYQTMLEKFRRGIVLQPTTRFGMMDDYFRWKKGESNLWVGYGNHGKSFFVLQLMLTKSIYDGWKWGIFSPENWPADDFLDDLVEMYVGKWISNMSEQEYVGALEFLNHHFFYVYPEDSHDLLSIHEKFRYLVLTKGIDGVLVDPWNQLDHLQGQYQRDDQYLSLNLKDVTRFMLLNNVSYNIIAHPKNPTYNSDRSLPIVDMYDIAGGAMWGNKIYNIISYYRPNFHINKSDPAVKIVFQKVKRKRTGGQHGEIDLVLLWDKKRYVDPATNEIFCDPQMALIIKAQEQKIEGELPSSDGWNPADIDF